MNKQNLNRGKKLAKKELEMITGGGEVRCKIYGDRCYYYGPGCREKECQPPVPVDPIDDYSIII
ncbi:hypothetical protein [Chryseobacterium sp. BIGb0232]|uniref:hypothetical protein n=1 Tax=Chryseobacterium sp. BIGb0232 TaxID=2940598 RepID=UPI000F4941B9|nr:hypothetical protein [Chryseobacterium sp. BIGb0232]MCS4300591.1 hypothetical protein [Chryseobacterium sp. BIGb0232]ROS20523.1 hypothetical protein EDF65_1247 [Chryseobacterium nakagawai]